MPTIRIAQVLSLAGIVLVCVVGAAAQAPTPPPPTTSLSFIKEVGFPAAAFVMLFALVRSTLNENTKALNELRETVGELKGYLLRMSGNGAVGK